MVSRPFFFHTCSNYKARLSAGSGLMLEKFSDARRSAVNRSPAFEGFVISGFPVCEFGINHDARLKIEAERGLILKLDFNEAVVGRNGQFHFGNDLALRLRESENALVCALFGTLRDSHLASLRGNLVRIASAFTRWRSPSLI